MSNPFGPGQLTASQAAKLNDLWDFRERMQRMTGRPPFAVTLAGGVPIVSGDPPKTLLCEVTVNDGAVPPSHTVKRKTRDAGNAIVDYQPLGTFENVLDPAEVGFDVGTLVGVLQFPDQDGYRWAWPAAGGSSPAAAVYGEQDLAAGIYTITADNTFQDTGFSFVLPEAGTYLILGAVYASGSISAWTAGVTTSQYIQAQLYDAATAAAVINSTATIVTVNGPMGGASLIAYGSAPIHVFHTVAAATTIKIYALRSNSGGGFPATWATSFISDTGRVAGGPVTIFHYLKIA